MRGNKKTFVLDDKGLFYRGYSSIWKNILQECDKGKALDSVGFPILK